MTLELPAGLAEWVAKSGPSALLNAVRLRVERSQRTESGTLPALELSANQRREIGLMLGVQWELSDKPVNLQALARALAEHGLSVRELVEAVNGGPIEEKRERRERDTARAAAERTRVIESLLAAGIDQSEIDTWLADPGLPRAGSGVLAPLAADAARVWGHLPHQGSHVRLARLAADVLHNSHALDADETLGRAIARLAAVVQGLERPQRGGPTWRQAWASVGVQCDGVSSRVLTLNLPLTGTAPAARLCGALRGEPTWLTLRSLAGDWIARAGVTVFVCENPTIVEAAADAFGPECPPLVCTDGIASGAAMDLIAGLAGSGCSIKVRADVDPAGFTVVEQVLAMAPDAQPWRFDAHVYAAAHGLSVPEQVPRGTEDSIEQLRDTYRVHQLPLHEERILDDILLDLRQPPA